MLHFERVSQTEGESAGLAIAIAIAVSVSISVSVSVSISVATAVSVSVSISVAGEVDTDIAPTVEPVIAPVAGGTGTALRAHRAFLVGRWACGEEEQQQRDRCEKASAAHGHTPRRSLFVTVVLPV